MQAARIALSLGATLVGWATGLAYYISLGYLTDALGWRSDLPAIAVYAGWYCLLGWFIVFLPILRTMSPDSKLFSFRRAPFLGALLGLAAFIVLVAWQIP